MKTAITGKRIKQNTLKIEHFDLDLQFPEVLLKLNHPTHDHINKELIDSIVYSGNKSIIDLKEYDDLILEIIASRRNNLNLSGTLDLKADKIDLDEIKQEVLTAGENGETLSEVITNFKLNIENQINDHFGAITHEELDSMYSDYSASKDGQISLLEKLNSMGLGDGSGTLTLNTINQWETFHTIQDNGLGQPELSFTIAYDFVENSNTIQVFEGPLLMKKGIDYTEDGFNSITMIETSIGEEYRIIGVSTFSLWAWHESVSLIENQFVIPLTNTYTINSGELVVYESGLLLRKGIDYNEYSNNTIHLLDFLPTGVTLEIYKRR